MLRLEFDKQEYLELVEKCMLNEELAQILEYRIKNYSITKIAMIMNISESTVSRRIKQLRKKIIKAIWHCFFLW